MEQQIYIVYEKFCMTEFSVPEVHSVFCTIDQARAQKQALSAQARVVYVGETVRYFIQECVLHNRKPTVFPIPMQQPETVE